MLLARNSQNERLQAELRTHTQILNVEKEEHRKLLESIQTMTYKNLEIERDQARKAIVNAGVDEVIYQEEYRDTTGIEILKNSGVVTRTFSSTRE